MHRGNFLPSPLAPRTPLHPLIFYRLPPCPSVSRGPSLLFSFPRLTSARCKISMISRNAEPGKHFVIQIRPGRASPVEFNTPPALFPGHRYLGIIKGVIVGPRQRQIG